MRLTDVLCCFVGTGIIPDVRCSADGVIEISGITYNSSEVQPGWLFVAIPGRKLDGHRFIPDALERGVAAIVGACPVEELAIPRSVAYVRVDDPRRALGLLACQLAGQPSRYMTVFGVTGTDGKTTTTHLIAAILDAAGYRTGLTSSVDFKIANERIANHTRFTNLEAPETQSLLAQMVDERVGYAVLEVTSSGLEMERVAGIAFDVAVVTNITREHQEAHDSKDAYWRAKAMLFERIEPECTRAMKSGCSASPVCVLNADDASFAFLSKFCRAPMLTYGIDNPGADVNAKGLDLRLDGSTFDVYLPDGQCFTVEVPLVSRFNVSNCLAAIAATWSQGVNVEAMVRGLANFAGVSGRMEYIDVGQRFTVIVDYAHTAESLRQVLTFLRPLTSGRLIAVLGDAGDRDRLKRAEKGKVAAEYTDWFVITDEDPRTEDAAVIRREIAAAAELANAQEGVDFICQAGRREGIARAFAYARAGDTVVLFGKGHEQTLIVGRERLCWDERSVARELLLEM